MITETFISLGIAARQLLRNWRSALVLAAVYAVLLASLYLFVTTKETNLSQVALTFSLVVAIPVLFFVLQSLSVNSGGDQTLGAFLKKSLFDLWKVLLISLPIILLGVLTFFVLTKVQGRLTPANVTPTPQIVSSPNTGTEVKPPINWGFAGLTTIRYLAFGLLLPLTLIQLWLVTVKEGLGAAIRGVKEELLSVVSPRSVLIYMSGFVVFGVLPYFLLFKTVSSERAWLEFSFFVGRIMLVFVLTLFGWVMTLQALSVSKQRAQRLTTDAGL